MKAAQYSLYDGSGKPAMWTISKTLSAADAVELVAATLARHNLHAYTALVAAIEYTED